MEHEPRMRINPTRMASKNFDFIIVGAGSAGCLLANRLSADPSHNVLLVEAGHSDRRLWSQLPIGYYRTIYNERYSRVFDTEPSQGTNGRGIKWPRGRIIGGSSSINGLIFIRGQPQDFDDWQDMGASGWSYQDVLPYFRKLECYASGENQYRGNMGELKVDDLRLRHPACEAWLEAAKNWGLPALDDFNGTESFGRGRYQLSLDGRWRSSSSRAFLWPALKRSNLSVVSGALVERVIIEKRRAVGIAYGKNGQSMQAFGGRIILSAGTLQTPQLLQLSGVGPAPVLKRHGIDVVLDMAAVGQNLQDHYQMRTIVKVENSLSLNSDIRNPFKIAGWIFDWLKDGSGMLSVGAGQVGAGACTKYAEGRRPDIQILVMPLSVDKPGEPLHNYPGFTVTVWQCHPLSRGSIEIQSRDPRVQPRISPNYLSHPHDRKVLVEGVKILREIYRQPPFAELWSEEIVPGENVTSDEAILEAVKSGGGTVFHPAGTCRMGSDDQAVVDPELRVREIAGLYIVDASVMPKVASANINAAVLMIGEKAAAHILTHEGG